MPTVTHDCTPTTVSNRRNSIPDSRRPGVRSSRRRPQARRFARPAALVLAVLSIALSVPRAGAEPSDREIGEEQVYTTPGRALREIFEHVTRVDTVTARLSAEELGRLRDRLGFAVASDTVTVYEPRDSTGALIGYAVIGDEVGKYRPITFMVGTRPDLAVRGVEVLVYRESRGGEIRHARFLRQYRGKDPADPIRTNRDVLNVAGATLSVNAMNRGVKRALVTLELLRKRGAL